MKTKSQKQEELKQGKEFLKGSQFLMFADFTRVASEDVRRLRRELSDIGAKFFVIKKRLLNILLKEKGIDFDARSSKMSVGTVFASETEKSAALLFKFFKALGVEKEKILGGYDVRSAHALDASVVCMIGQLPPREVLLAQLAGTIAAPIRSFLYVLQEKSKATHSTVAQGEQKVG